MSAASSLLQEIEKAFDYRGDVTLTLKDGRKIEGYVFNRELTGNSRCPEAFVEVMQPGSNENLLVRCADIEKVEFTGEDTAAGKSWDEFQAKESARKAADAQKKS
jgi:hypothetical protein